MSKRSAPDKSLNVVNVRPYSPGYAFGHRFLRLAFHTFYRTRVTGIEKIPFDQPLIFAVNHQNALMDGLALVTQRAWQPAFLSRGDIFQNPLQRRILLYMKMMPVYRMRDGFHTLENNEATFQKTLELIKMSHPLIIFPEGQHCGVKRLHTLMKGLARLAFQAEEAAQGSPGLRVVPVGLEYEHYHRFRSRLLINFGEPIAVSDFRQLHSVSPARGLNALMDAIGEGIRKVMIHIDDTSHYDNIAGLLDLLAHADPQALKAGTYERFKADKQRVEHLNRLRNDNPGAFSALIEAASGVLTLLRARRAEATDVATLNESVIFQGLRWLVLLLFSPVFLYGFINNLPVLAMIRAVTRRFKDPHFETSGRLALGFAGVPLTWLIQTGIIALVTNTWVWPLAYVLTLPAVSLAAHAWYRLLRQAAVACRVRHISDLRLKITRLKEYWEKTSA